MARALKKIAFVCEEFINGSVAQQLLDRFMVGYPRDGEFHRCGAEIHLWVSPWFVEHQELGIRLKRYPLRRHEKLEEAVAGADGIVVVPRLIPGWSLEIVKLCIDSASAGACMFAYGAIAAGQTVLPRPGAKDLLELAASRKVTLASGTSAAVTWRLPEVDVPAGARVKRALIVVQGEKPIAELYGIDGLLPLLEKRAGGERGVKSVRLVKGDAVWAARDDVLPKRLLAAAISRSDSPQGDPVRDGRTQDLVGLGLVPKLAKNPRVWAVEHTDGVRSAIAVLNGVVNDFNFAVELADGSIVSAQIYRPPAPQRHEFSRVAQVVEKFFESGRAPWPTRRSVLTAGLLDAFARARTNQTVPTKELTY